MRGDGDGWSRSPDGSKHWGKHGAAGLLLRAPLEDGQPAVLLQHRAIWSHQGGTWALPGGAKDSHESNVHAAVREAEEEAGILMSLLRVRAERVTARAGSGWSYTTVIADAASTLATRRNGESTELRWVPEAKVHELRLHPGFAASWSQLRAQQVRLVLGEHAEAAALNGLLPRTIELPNGGFGWLSGEADAVAAADPTILTAVISEHAVPGSTLDSNILAIALADVLS